MRYEEDRFRMNSGDILVAYSDGITEPENDFGEFGESRLVEIVSEVAGRADIVVVPDLEAGNMPVKQLAFLAGAEAAGVVVGARVPIILTSRADSANARLASCALAVLMARSGTLA